MMRNTNFARPANRRVWPVVVTIWLAATVAAGLCLATLFGAKQFGQDSNSLENHIATLHQDITGLENENTDVPSAENLQKLTDEANLYNQLSGIRRVPLLAVLQDLEIQLPKDVWVSQLNYDLETGRFDLSLQAEQETQLPPALSRIEGSALLKAVILERQVRLQQGRKSIVQYDIEALVK